MIDLVFMRDCEEHNKLAVRLLTQYKDYFYSDAEVTIESHRRFLNSTDRRCEFLWVVESDGNPCGMISVYHIDDKNKKCEFGRIVVDNEYKGIGSVMEFMILDFVFSLLGMNKLYCEVLSDNHPAIRLHTKFGFKQEAFYYDHVYKSGKFRHAVSMAIRHAEWMHIKQEKAARYADRIGCIKNGA